MSGVGMWLDSKSSKSLLGFEPVSDPIDSGSPGW